MRIKEIILLCTLVPAPMSKKVEADNMSTSQLLDLLNWYLADLFGLEILIELCNYSNIVWCEP